VESEYQAVIRQAETEFVRGLLADLRAGTFDGLPIWLRFHELKETGGDMNTLFQFEQP
jgi:hypothetical protein